MQQGLSGTATARQAFKGDGGQASLTAPPSRRWPLATPTAVIPIGSAASYRAIVGRAARASWEPPSDSIRIALVTGANKRLGLEIARRLAAAGLRVRLGA